MKKWKWKWIYEIWCYWSLVSGNFHFHWKTNFWLDIDDRDLGQGSSIFEKLKNPDATYFSETVESPVLIVVTGALAMEQALWNFVVIGIKKYFFLFGHFSFFFIFQAILQKIQKVINCQLGCCPFYEQFANFAMESPPRWLWCTEWQDWEKLGIETKIQNKIIEIQIQDPRFRTKLSKS